MRRNRTASAGFTLTELVVAMGMAVILLLVVVSVMAAGGDGYGMANRRVNANVEARAALTTLNDDLAGLWFDDNFVVKEGDGPWPSGELSFLALKPRSAQDSGKAAGDLCFVHYYTAVTQQLEEERGPHSRKLYRRLVSSADVMEALREGKDFKTPVADPGRIEDEPVAFNVVQFGVQVKVSQAGGTAKDWTNGDGRPDYLEVVLRVTDNETAGLLTSADDWESGGVLAGRLLGEGAGSDEGRRLRSFSVTIPVTGSAGAEDEEPPTSNEGGDDV